MANVAARMVFFPQTVTDRKNVTEPRLDLAISFPDVYDGAKVRLVVYQLDMYARGALCKRGEPSPGFQKFKQGDLTRAFLDNSKVDAMYGTELNPKLGPHTGILLKLDGTLLRSQKVKSPRGWWFGLTGTPEENTDKPYSILRFHMPTTQEDAIAGRVNAKAIARIILLNDTVQNMYANHRLAFRMALTSAHAGIAAGGVIASSLCPEHNPAVPPEPKSNPKNAGVVIWDEAAVKKGMPHPIGGGGESSPAVPATPNPRVMPFDLTGYYEHVNPGKDPAILLHLNQAGHALVGWFAFPIPVPGGPVPGTIAGWPTTPGCLWVSSLATEDKAKGYQFFWASQSSGGVNQMDPDAIVPHTNGAPGWIKRGTDPTDPKIDAVVLTFEHNDGSQAGTVTLRKVTDEARWPWAVISDASRISAEEREVIIAQQVRPVTNAVWARVREQMNPKTVLEKGPPEKTIQSVIVEWAGTTNPNVRWACRETISKHLLHVLGPFIGLVGDYEHQAALQIKAAATKYKVTVGTTTNTVYAWLMMMVTQYLSDMIDMRDAGDSGLKGKTDAQMYEEKVENGFRRAEFAPEGKYIYTMTFTQIAGTPDFVPVVNAYWFTVTINKEVEAKDGSRTQDTTWGNKGWDKKSLHGVMTAVGVAIGKGGKPGKGGSVPEKMEARSFASLTLPDFEGAKFTVVALKGPTAKVGPGGVTTHDSSMIQFYLKNGVQLTSILSENWKAGTDLGKPGIEGPELAGGAGWLMSSIPKAEKPPDDTSKDIVKEKDTKTGVFVLFARDSATIEQRTYFERRLALNRAMFLVGSPHAKTLGYASPEGTSEHNRDLSKRRANAVKMAVLDAFDASLALTNFAVEGLGEEPSINTGKLLNPPGKTDDEKKRIHEEALTQYPVWRCVDFWIEGNLVLRARPKEEQKGKP